MLKYVFEGCSLFERHNFQYLLGYRRGFEPHLIRN